MPGVFPVPSRLPATAVLNLSPARPGVSGSARLATGEAVPLARLLSRVLDQYGLAAAEQDDSNEVSGNARAAGSVDLLA
jgi:hypothetical protein